MEFQHKPHEEVYQKVTGYLRQMFGESLGVHTENPSFMVQSGSAYVFINVWPWGDDDAVITARAYVVSGADLNLELCMYLLTENDKMRFGAFGVDKDMDIFFEHTIVGSTCDLEELKATVLAVGYTSNEYDDKIVERWGGTRAVDRK